ncbi:MAG TPA: hypothetical protein VJ991_12795 [Balneolales bacterium]|nr:hypothetical protein [Balneolales bacterium]
MSTFELNDESAIDLLIFWVEGADGLMGYEEDKEVNEILNEMSYSPQNYQHTINYLNGLTTKHIDDKIDEAIEWTKKYEEQKRRYILALLQNLAEIDGPMSKEEREKIDELHVRYGLSN